MCPLPSSMLYHMHVMSERVLDRSFAHLNSVKRMNCFAREIIGSKIPGVAPWAPRSVKQCRNGVNYL